MMQRIISGAIIATSLLSSMAFADTLPFCGSVDDSMLGACQPAISQQNSIKNIAASELDQLAPHINLPIIKYIGQDPIFPTPTPDLPTLKTIPLIFPTQPPNTQNTISTTISAPETTASPDFPIAYKTIEEEKQSTPKKGIMLKTIPIENSPSPFAQNTTFLSRGEACDIIANAAWLPLLNSAEEVTIFHDVNTETPFFSAINALKNITAIDGYEDGNFRPNERINQAEGYKMLAITFHLSTAADETKGGDWYAEFKTSLEKVNAIPSSFSTDDSESISREDLMMMIKTLQSIAK